MYTTWISAGDRPEEGDGRLPDGGAGKSHLVRWAQRGQGSVHASLSAAQVTRKEIEDGRAISGEASEVDDMSASSLLRWMGSTAVLEVGAEKVVLANCGDLRAVQCRCGVAVQPSCDH